MVRVIADVSWRDMRASIVSGASFAAGIVVAFICGAAIDVYLLGHVERIKGANTTFLILIWFAPVLAFLTALTYVLGAKTWGFLPPKLPSLISGGLIAAVFWPLGWASQYLPQPFSIGITWILILAGSFCAARIIRARSVRWFAG
jgi:hypothetical protein